MKDIFKTKRIWRMTVFTAIAMVLGFVLIACPSSGPGGTTNGDTPLPEGTAFSVSGSFTKAGGGDVQFNLSDTASAGRFARSVTADSYAVSGELEDGGIIFRLSGTYDPVSRSYTASSASSFIRYSINGAFNSAGQSLGSTATLLVRNPSELDEWLAFSYVIEEAAAAIQLSGEETTDNAGGGIPAFARGWWSFTDSHDGYTYDANVLLSEWTITQDSVQTDPQGGKEFESFSASVIEVSQAGSVYNVIMGFPVYFADKATAEAAALQFKTAQGLSAVLLPEDPYAGIGTGYYWYVEQGDGFLSYGFLLPEEYMGGGGGPGPVGDFISAFEMVFIGDHDRLPLKHEIVPAIRDFINELIAGYEKPIVVEELDGPPQDPVIPDSLVYWYNEEGNDIIWAYFMGFTGVMQWDKIMPWYTTNYLERYLINAGVNPQTWYSRSRISFTSNNTLMIIADYYKTVDSGIFGEYREFMFATVAETRALTEYDPDNVIMITR